MIRNLVVIAILATVPLSAVSARADDLTSAQGRSSSVLDNPLAAHSLDELSATRDRPLFTPNRRPPAVSRVESPPPAPPPAPPNLALFGIIVDADGASAVVRGAASEKTVHVRVGDEVDGWKIAEIDQRRLILARDDRSVTFTMFNGGHAEQSTVVPHHVAPVLELNSAGVLRARRPRS